MRGGGVGVEAERLVAALERAVGAMELLATLPAPETSVSLHAFLSSGDDRADDALVMETMETLASHFRLEATLQRQQTEKRQRHASVAAARQLEQKRTQTEEEKRQEDGEPRALVEEHEAPSERPEEDDQAQETEEAEDDDDDDDDTEDWANDAVCRFPASLHAVLRLLSHDKRARDTLRRRSATRISRGLAAFVHGLTDLAMLSERRLASTPDQDVAHAQQLRDTTQRLVEQQDDAAQLRFELTQEREARESHAVRHALAIASLREQLHETQRHADEALRATLSSREHDATTLRAQRDADRLAASEQLLALASGDARVAGAHQQQEIHDRKRVARSALELQELLRSFDAEMETLDAAVAAEIEALSDQEAHVQRLRVVVERIDDDRRHQLEEQRQRDRAQQREDLNLFKFVTRCQAAVRGFLARRRVRLDLSLRQRRKKKKKKKKTTKKTAKTKSPSSSGAVLAQPKRPASAASANATRTKRPARSQLL